MTYMLTGGAMQIALVMTVIGKDRTGLIESVARVVEEHGGNWLESRMCRLGGEFAGILRIHVPGEKEKPLVRALQDLREQGLTVSIQSDPGPASAAPGRLFALEILGHDRPGIVHQISAALAHKGVNVEDLKTECTSAPMSGERLFKAAARLQVPESCPINEVQSALEQIAGHLMVDISLAGVRIKPQPI
jgi:glycine cleavage system regulatory protein